ncbi:MAG: hypothetical protein J2P37_26975, partial [Ktedonobacteraceae bacterium]|nr:hypothetical protein [Ktedonobacteraceae bacterium]
DGKAGMFVVVRQVVLTQESVRGCLSWYSRLVKDMQELVILFTINAESRTRIPRTVLMGL